jgi:anti-sigma regulatory factor (Ser/Thr protein kinase)
MQELVLRPEPSSPARARRFVSEYLAAQGVSDDECFEVLTALNEAVSNAYRYGVRDGGRTEIKVTIVGKAPIEVTIADNGPGFDFDEAQVARPPVLSHGGRGFFLMNELMDDVKVATGPSGTEVTLVRHCHCQSANGTG